MPVEMVVEVEPGVGIGPVRLEMTEAEVLAVMGEPQHRRPDWLQVGQMWAWHQSCFQVSFGGSRTVGEIMISFGGDLEALYAGIDLLNTPAAAVIAALSMLEQGHPTEDGYSYTFPGLQLALWHQSRPEDGPEDNEQYRGGLYWDTVSTWTDDYQGEIAAAAADRRQREG